MFSLHKNSWKQQWKLSVAAQLDFLKRIKQNPNVESVSLLS